MPYIVTQDGKIITTIDGTPIVTLSGGGSSVRQQIMNAIDTRLKGILTASGFETNIGQNVSDWLAESLEESDLPALIYRDTSVETEVVNFNQFVHRMAVNVIVAVQNSTPMVEIRKILADIDEAIGLDETWGSLALMTERQGDESGVEIAGKKFAGCQVNFLVTFRTLGWDAYIKQ